MDRLSVALYLIEAAKLEKVRLKAYEARRDNIRQGPNYWDEVIALDREFYPVPKKSVINDNLKTARRLLLAEYIK